MAAAWGCGPTAAASGWSGTWAACPPAPPSTTVTPPPSQRPLPTRLSCALVERRAASRQTPRWPGHASTPTPCRSLMCLQRRRRRPASCPRTSGWRRQRPSWPALLDPTSVPPQASLAAGCRCPCWLQPAAAARWLLQQWWAAAAGGGGERRGGKQQRQHWSAAALRVAAAARRWHRLDNSTQPSLYLIASEWPAMCDQFVAIKPATCDQFVACKRMQHR